MTCARHHVLPNACILCQLDLGIVISSYQSVLIHSLCLFTTIMAYVPPALRQKQQAAADVAPKSTDLPPESTPIVLLQDIQKHYWPSPASQATSSDTPAEIDHDQASYPPEGSVKPGSQPSSVQEHSTLNAAQHEPTKLAYVLLFQHAVSRTYRYDRSDQSRIRDGTMTRSSTRNQNFKSYQTKTAYFHHSQTQLRIHNNSLPYSRTYSQLKMQSRNHLSHWHHILLSLNNNRALGVEAELVSNLSAITN